MDQQTPRTVDLQIGNEIVVEQEHVRLVGDELATFGVKVTSEDADGRLGLSRLMLSGEAASADAATTDPGLADGVRTDWTQALGAILVDGGPTPTNLDVCLAAMRKRFAGQYGGFYPTMGKNRDVADIEGLPYISGGASKVPEPVPTSELHLKKSTEGAGVRVGIADTPIFAHPQLTGRYAASGATYQPHGAARPAAGHATFIAGLVLERAPGAFLVVRPVLDIGARGTSWDVAQSLMSFLDDKEEDRVDVLPLAFGTYARDGRPPLVLARAVERLAPHIVVLAAAGNHGEEPAVAGPGRLTRRTVAYPAAIDGVCAVTAVDDGGEFAPFSPPLLPWFELAAPGVNVASLYLDGPVLIGSEGAPKPFKGAARWSGSSFAVATVAGEVARRTIPGRVTAREALDEILHGAAVENGIYPV